MDPDDTLLRRILTDSKTIAVVGFSANPQRPSHGVARFLASQGKRVIPVNPGLAGQSFLGEVVVARVADITTPIDMVDVFRAADAVPELVDEVLALSPLPRTVWLQLGIRHEEAAARARARGLTVVQDRCPAIEWPRLIG